MLEQQIEYFHGNKLEIEKEKQKKQTLMSYFPKMLGTVDKTRYVLVDDDKQKTENKIDKKEIYTPTPIINSNESDKSNGQQSKPTATKPSFENNKKTINSDSWKESVTFLEAKKKDTATIATRMPFEFKNNNTPIKHNPFKLSSQYKELEGMYKNKPQPNKTVSDSLGMMNENIENRLDSVSYNDKGHMSVTFRNDILTKEQFRPFDSTDKAGCKRRCMEMLAYSGCELSGKRIDMTINNDNGRAISQSNDFQNGINAINNALDKKQSIILNVDYKDGTAESADKAGDHFIVVVGKTIINGITYYHFYDPATQFTNLGTANTNVLYVKDGFLQGSFAKRNGDVNKYKVTSVRLNK